MTASGIYEGAGDKTGSKIKANKNTRDYSVTHQQFSEASMAPRRTSSRENTQAEREAAATRKEANMKRSKKALSNFVNKHSKVSKMSIVFDRKTK